MTTCYLIHLESKIGNPDNPRAQAQHYIGYTHSLADRIQRHLSGTGAALLRAARIRGIRWAVVRTWPGGGRDMEKKLKARKKAASLCPFCKGSIDKIEYICYDELQEKHNNDCPF